MAVSLGEHCIRPWREVAAVCRDAAVFLDDGAGELLHWAGGLALLEGSIGVYDLFGELSPVARDFISKAPYCHVVIVVTSFLHGRTSEKISRLLSDLQPLECHVFCSQSEEMHSELLPMPSELEGEGGTTTGYSHFGEFQALLRKWTNRELGVRVCVSYMPLFHCEVCPGLFTTPPNSALFPLLPSDVETIQARLINEGDPNMSVEYLYQVDFDMLSHDFQTNLKSFANGLNCLLQSLDMQEEIFSLGSTSRFIANQLSNLTAARTRRKTAANRCSLVIVDRTLDLTSPSTHATESLADRILSLLPHCPADSNDVCVDMRPIASSCGGSDGDSTGRGATIAPGSLAQPGNAKAQQLLKILIQSKQKESMMELSRCLLDSLSQEGLSVKLTGKLARPSAQQLTAFLHQFRGHQDASISQTWLLQIACAVLQTLESPSNKHWDQLAGIEKILIHGLIDNDSPNVASQLTELTQKQLQGHTSQLSPTSPVAMGAKPITVSEETSIAELLGLAVAMFSLSEEKCFDSDREINALKEVMAELVLRWRECDADSAKLLGLEKSDSKARIVGRLSTIFQQLIQLGESREQLTQFRHTLLADDHTPFPYRPLLCQLVDAIFSPSLPDLSDLHYHPHGTTATNIIKSGFSLFMSSAKARPHQYPTLVLFVVGGVSCNEVRQIREILASRKVEVQVMIGSTKLLTPKDLLGLALCRENAYI